MSSNGNHHPKLTSLILGAIGVVYGDIGTSPLYTLKECVSEAKFSINEAAIFGFLSLIFWAITIVVSIKYVVFILRADNHGEGGILALLSLTLRKKTSKFHYKLFIMGVIGASLFYGDAIITPAISVLSAVEGITVATPEYHHWVVPIAIIILLILFMTQKVGTSRIGSLFGPAVLIWFSVIGTLGLIQIYKAPYVLRALNPLWALQLFHDHGFKALLSLGAVVLAITGSEALYADLGHFGRSAIRRAWFFLVFPCLILNYFG
ncbi:MAG TPA: KUP/HAK/KT family potassium transporter, partial [Candidatus Nitrosotenuis sp.]|nr:KUP/HAK/KT family potassium transporter [Candidatus Nitrosotenuis sp.]